MVKEVTCNECEYSWLTNHKRPDPRFITCPNCRANVELRKSKFDDAKMRREADYI